MKPFYTVALAPLLALASPAAAQDAATPLSPRDIYQRVGPAVVFIFAASEDGTGEIGTGSIVDATHVVTNAHVVVRASSGAPWPMVRVYLKPAKITGDNKKDLHDPVSARVARFDRQLDVALLELQDPPSGLTVMPVGDSASVSPGDPVVAIGHPEQGGLWTLTQGVVGTVLADFDKVPGKDVFQTDASINRGNSGGPLLGRDGAMIGVNTAMSRRAPDGLAITAVNFSLQANVVRKWLDGGGDVKVAMLPPPSSAAAATAKPAVAAQALAPAPAAEQPAKPAVVAEAPKPAAVAPKLAAAAPKPEAPKAAILTPAKPYKAEDLIQQEIGQMEDLEKEMQQEVQRVRSSQ